MKIYTSDENKLEFHSLADDIRQFLISNPNKFFTPAEISENINSIPYSNLKSALSFANAEKEIDPSKHIDSICSYLEKQNLIRKVMKICPYKGIPSNAFSNF